MRAHPALPRLLVLTLLAGPPLAALDYDWDGGGDGVSWSDPLNWDLDSGFPGPGDRARFDTGGSVSLTAAIPGDFAEAVIASGRVDLLHGGNANAGGTYFIDPGATLGAKEGTLGGASVVLRGGTLALLPGTVVEQSGLQERWFSGGVDADYDDALLDPMVTGNPLSLLARIPTTSRVLDVGLSFLTDALINSRSGGLGQDRVAGLWLGHVHIGAVGSGAPLEAGPVTFGTRSDDGSAVWLDLDQNEVFDAPGELLVNNKGQHPLQNRVGTAHLAAGRYAIAIAFYERTGGAGMEARFGPGTVAEADYGTLSVVDPSSATQSGLFTYPLSPPGTFGNAFQVEADSTVRLVDPLPEAALGPLTLAGSHTLTVESDVPRQRLDAATSVTLAGDARFVTSGQSELVLRTMGESTASTVTFAGDGVIRLPTANTHTGLSTVESGLLEVAANQALGATATGTVVQDGATLRFPGGVVYSATEPLTLFGAGLPGAGGALLNLSGNNDFYGPVTLGDTATIRCAAGLLRLFGSTDVAGHELTLRADANIEFQNGGLTGAGQIVQRGTATVIVFANADAGTNFDAHLRIFDGTWDARGVNSLGTTNGVTVVENNGRLLLRDGRTWAEAITLNGNDGGTGALRSENNANTLNGPITLDSAAMIFVNETQLTVNGPILGPHLLEKSGTGTLILNGVNEFDRVELQGGELRIPQMAALGNTTSLQLDVGEALELAQGFTLGGGAAFYELVFNGGAVTALAGDSLVDLDVRLTPFGPVRVGGPGNLDLPHAFLIPAFSGTSDALNHYGFHTGVEALLNLDGNGGLLNAGRPAEHPHFAAVVAFTTGPGNRGLDFDNDQDFLAAGAVGQVDNYANIWLGYLNVPAGAGGNWVLRCAADDDRAGIWLDLNQNGVLESSTPGLGSNRGEQLAWEDSGAKTVNLAPGAYLVAFTHLEFGGGSQADFRYRSPSMGAEAVIRPADPAQAGLWSLAGFDLPGNRLVKFGAGRITLAGANAHTMGNTVLGGTLIAAHDQALGDPAAPLRIEAGSLALSGGVAVEVGEAAVNGSGAAGSGGALDNWDGTNTFTAALLAPFDGPDQVLSVGARAGHLTVHAPPLDLRLARLVLGGAGDLDFHPVVLASLSAPVTLDLARAYLFNGNATRLPGDASEVARRLLTAGHQAYYPNEIDWINLWGSSIVGLNNSANPGDPNNYGNTIAAEWTLAGTGSQDALFRVTNSDDGNRIRLDLNRDGVFGSGDEDPFGQDRGGTFTTTVPVSVPRGVPVPVLLQHREGGGSSRLQPEYSFDNGATWQRFTVGTVSGTHFGLTLTPSAQVVKRGEGVATLHGAHAHAGGTRVEAGALALVHDEAAGPAGATVTVAGGSLVLEGGRTLTDKILVLSGLGAPGLPGALVQANGTSTLAASVSLSAASTTRSVGLGTLDADLLVHGPLNLQAAALTVDGPGQVLLNGPLSGLGADNTPPPEPFAGSFHFNQIGSPNFDTQGWTVVRGFAGAHDQGGGDFAATAGRSAGDYAHDAVHPTFLLSSPMFVLDGSGDLTWQMVGGDSNGRALPSSRTEVLANPTSSNATGVQGIGLRRVDTDAYVLTKAASNDNFNGTLSFTAAELALLDQNALYTLDFFDYYDGGWGWVSVDDVVIPGLKVDALPVDNRVVKRGTGTLILAGENTYDGGTQVEAGRLLANHPVGSAGSNTLIAQEGGIFGGTGAVTNLVLVGSRGEIHPGASAGRLTVDNSVTFANFSAVLRAELDGHAVAGVDYDQLVVSGSLNLSGATLVLDRDPGYAPAVGQTLTLATAGALSGTFSGLPEGGRVSARGAEFALSYAGQAVTLTATGGLRAYARTDALFRVGTNGVDVAVSSLLANDGVGAGPGPLQLIGVSSESEGGGSVALVGGRVVYTPSPSHAGADSFIYTLSDGLDEAIGLVSIWPTSAPGEAADSRPSGLRVLSDGSHRVTFVGTPGHSYEIEFTQDLVTQPVVWQGLGRVTADALGQLEIDHALPPPGILYYRAVLP
jgi:autotransporter-associated beta strand protein